jgi:hypothetical protein
LMPSSGQASTHLPQASHADAYGVQAVLRPCAMLFTFARTPSLAK